MKPAIVVIGSSNTDMIIRVDHIPRPGETLLGGEFTTAAGGKGANQAVAAARAGGEVSFVARVGRDVFGDQALAGFKRDGIRRVVVRPRAPSGVALIFVVGTREQHRGGGRREPALVSRGRGTGAPGT
jgi:ribokinase